MRYQNMSKTIEVINSLSDEMTVAEARETLKAAADADDKANSNLYSRAKKAEGFEYDKDSRKWIKKEAKTNPSVKEAKSNELDYGQLAFHNSKTGALKIENSEDVEFLREQIKETGKSQEALLNANWFQNELKDKQTARIAQAAAPTGGKPGGSTDRNSVDYYLQTGETPPADNPELRRKVVNAKMAKEQSGQSNYTPDNKQQGSSFTGSGIEIK